MARLQPRAGDIRALGVERLALLEDALGRPVKLKNPEPERHSRTGCGADAKSNVDGPT